VSHIFIIPNKTLYMPNFCTHAARAPIFNKRGGDALCSKSRDTLADARSKQQSKDRREKGQFLSVKNNGAVELFGLCRGYLLGSGMHK
jgi:hypothetical protein